METRSVYAHLEGDISVMPVVSVRGVALDIQGVSPYSKSRASHIVDELPNPNLVTA